MLSVDSYILLFFIFLSLIGFFYLFILAPFRNSQLIVLFSIFSFGLRPLLSINCYNFNPFYFYDKFLYLQGNIISNIYVLFFLLGLVIFSRSINKELVVDRLSIKRLLNVLIVFTVITDVVTIAKYGVIILPGVRTTGLSKAAPGSQVFFAITSTFTFLSSALAVFLMLVVKGEVIRNITKLLIIFSLSMIFYQRGSFIMGAFFGLFLIGVYDKKRLFKDIHKKVIILIILLGVIVYGRVFVSDAVNYVLDKEAATHIGHAKQNQSFACKISNKANQEHDQVWPILLNYTQSKGADYYGNLIAALYRPFLTSEQREERQLLTSVDTLNIYNDRNTYQELNFGFSISGIQYHYYSIGLYSILLAFVLGALCALIENKMFAYNLNQKSLFKLYLLFQFIILLNSAMDERLKWVVFNVVLVFLVIYIINPLKNYFVRRL